MPRYGKRRRTRYKYAKRLFRRFKRRYKRKARKVGYKQNRKYLRVKCSYQFDVLADTSGTTKYAIPIDNPNIGHYRGLTSHPILLHPFEYLKPLYDYYRTYAIKLRWESNVKNAYSQYQLNSNDTPQLPFQIGPDWNRLTGHKIRCGMDTEDLTPLYGTTTPMVSNRVKSKAHSMQYNWSQYFKIKLPTSNVTGNNISRQAGNWMTSDNTTNFGGMIYIEQPSNNETNWDASLYIGRIYVDKFIILKQMNYHAGQEDPVLDTTTTVTAGGDYVGDETAEENSGEEDIVQA